MLKIALVTEELAVYGKSGGIGAAIYELALILCESGHEVDIIYLPLENFDEERKALAINAFLERRIKLSFVDPSKYVWNTNDVKNRSFAIYRYLSESKNEYDFIHFHDYKGLGFISCTAKDQGLGFSKTTLVVQLHGPVRWTLHANGSLFSHADQLLIDFMERESIRLADHVISPSQYLIDWLHEAGFTLPSPERIQVIKNACEQCVRLGTAAAAHAELSQVHELIFFGRHEPRKGIQTFCDALDLIAPHLAETETSVCFLGGLGKINGMPSGVYLSQRARKWNFPIEFRIGLGRHEALAFLASRPTALVVIPSSAENSPYTVVEAMAAGRPIVTSRAGGGKELIHADYYDEAVVDAEPETLAERLKLLTINGARIPRFAETPKEISAQWLAFHQNSGALPKTAPMPASKPRVVVGVTHFERPRKVIGAIMSILRQTYDNIEIVIVDDGSRSEETINELIHIEKLISRVGGRFIRRANGYLGAARNTIARETQSDYLLFLDDDDLLMPSAIEKLVLAAKSNDADIVNCLNYYMNEDVRCKYELYPETFEGKISYVPIGGPLSVAHLSNQLGAATALIKRSFFEKVGGYTEIKRVGFEDYEFYLRALQKGGKLSILPEPLYLYETGKPSMISGTSRIANKRRVVQAIELSSVSSAWQDAIELAAGRESVEDEQNYLAWLSSNSPHRAQLERIETARSDPPEQILALAEYARSIGAPAAATAWEQALLKPPLSRQQASAKGRRRLRSTSHAENVGSEIIAQLGVLSELATLWKLMRVDAAAAELGDQVNITGEASDDLIEFGFLLAASPDLKPTSAERLAQILSSAWADENTLIKLKGLVAILETRSGRYEVAKSALTEICLAESESYIALYDDLKIAYKNKAVGRALHHYHSYGRAEGRRGFEVMRKISHSLSCGLGKEVQLLHLHNEFDRVVRASR